MTRYAIVADLNRCVGCQTCTSACKHQNATAPGIQWRKVLDFEVGEFPEVSRAFVPVGCMHCDEPPCLEVCPSTATRKRADGIVTIDYDICIGCAYCAIACPYQARFRVDAPANAYGGERMRHERLRDDPARLGVAQKCTFCVERIDAGMAAGLVPGIDPEATPACVNSCIAGALTFGDIEDADSNVSTLLRENRHFRMHEDLGTGPGIYYLYDGEIGQTAPIEPAPMVAEPAGMAAVLPRLQHSWDWRAVGNFIFGGAGSGLLIAAALYGLIAPPMWSAVFLGLALVGAGLGCVWLEIGRPWRFLNVFRHPAQSWMSREAGIALAYFALGGLAWLTGALALLLLAAPFAFAFVYAQARILRAARGIPLWRQKQIVPLIVVTGLTEGAGLFAVVALIDQALAGVDIGLLHHGWLAGGLFALVVLRFALWQVYRRALGHGGAPKAALAELDETPLALAGLGQAIILVLVSAAFLTPASLGVAGALALLTGWRFKFALVTRAAFNQGYEIARMPARGAGVSGPGIRPGWVAE